MPHSPCHSLGSSYSSPQLSAILHGSNAVSFEGGFCLPSSCHSRTWLLDNFQETFSETTSCQLTSCEQGQFTEDVCAQSTCIPRVVPTTCSNHKPYERTTCQSGSSSAVLECASQPCQSGCNQQRGFVIQRCQPASYMAKCCPPKTSMSQSYQSLEYESCQYQSQICKSSSCNPVVNVAPGPQLLESSSSTYEPTCCVTGGLQLPSK